MIGTACFRAPAAFRERNRGVFPSVPADDMGHRPHVFSMVRTPLCLGSGPHGLRFHLADLRDRSAPKVLCWAAARVVWLQISVRPVFPVVRGPGTTEIVRTRRDHRQGRHRGEGTEIHQIRPNVSINSHIRGLLPQGKRGLGLFPSLFEGCDELEESDLVFRAMQLLLDLDEAGQGEHSNGCPVELDPVEVSFEVLERGVFFDGAETVQAPVACADEFVTAGLEV